MKTEDLKNYIFEQLNETSPERATALSRARWDEGRAAEQASRFAANHFNKIKKQSWINPNDRHPDEIKAIAMARDEFTNLAYEKYRKSSRALFRSLGRKGDGSPRTSKQESAFNFINGLKRLNETSPERATALAIARGDEGLKASEAGYLAAKHSVKIQKNPKNLDQRKIDAMNSATVQLMDLASEKFSKARKARNRSLGRKGDGSPRTPN